MGPRIDHNPKTLYKHPHVPPIIKKATIQLTTTKIIMSQADTKAPTTLKIFKSSPLATIPSKAYDSHDAGYDLAACFDKVTDTVVIPARGQKLIDTKLHFEIPLGNYGRVAPRSGLAVKHSIDIGAGVVDNSWRGTIQILLFNFSDLPYTVTHGDKIAQMIITPFVSLAIEEVASFDDLSSTSRGAKGFGSSGK